MNIFDSISELLQQLFDQLVNLLAPLLELLGIDSGGEE
jgi:hypothetical protein